MPSAPSIFCKHLKICWVLAVEAHFPSYDPEYHHWDFGKMSALREICLAMEGKYEYYYMGTLKHYFCTHSLMRTRLLYPLLYENAVQS